MKSFPKVSVGAVIAYLILSCLCWSTVAWAQESDSLQNAEGLLKQAIEKKQAGKTEEAVTLFEKAIRTNRRILGYDDEGLIQELRNFYEQKLETSPEDIAVLEPLGYIYAVCFSDFEKAIAQYKKVVELSTDDKVKERTNALIDRLTAQWEATRTTTAALESQTREEKVQEWKELEKQEALAAIADRVRDREDRMRELSLKKDEMEARLPQEEDQVKELEEEVDKADLYWRTTENRMYRRKRERLAAEATSKKSEISRMKTELDSIGRDLARLQKEADAEENLLKRKTDQGGSGPGNSQDDNEPENGNPPDANGNSSGSSSVGSPPDPSLPPVENPDFPTTGPVEGSVEDLSKPESGSATGTQWP